MQTNTNEIYEDFAEQLCEWPETGKAPMAGDQFIRAVLDMQKERLDKFRIKTKYQLKLRGESLDIISSHQYKGTKYSNWLMQRSYKRKVEYWSDGRKSLVLQGKDELYTIITDRNDANMDGDETYCCPNCGAINKIEVLTDKGCDYCGTRFVMSELFPKVTNYYYLKDYFTNKTEAYRELSKFIIAGIVILSAYVSPSALGDFMMQGQEEISLGGRIILLIWRYAVAGLLGAVLGFAANSCRLLISMFIGAARAVPKVVVQLDARNNVPKFMKEFDPDFSYEYFFGKVQSLVKLLIFTDDRSDLAVYEGKLSLSQFDTIVDSQFEGVLGLNRAWSEGGYCLLDLNVYMTNIYCKSGRLKKKSNVLRVILCRKEQCSTDYGFSIKKVNCKGCGGSFDASKIKHCPFCKCTYDLKEDDWAITYLHCVR